MRRLLLLTLIVLVWGLTSEGAVNTVRRGCVLGWTGNTEPDLAGYRVYHGRVSQVPDGAYLEVGTGVLTATCAQLGLTQGIYYVWVRAFDTATPPNESTASTELTVEVLVQVRVY
jgi:hypothetical protein